jgi:hypothetical protein
LLTRQSSSWSLSVISTYLLECMPRGRPLPTRQRRSSRCSRKATPGGMTWLLRNSLWHSAHAQARPKKALCLGRLHTGQRRKCLSRTPVRSSLISLNPWSPLAATRPFPSGTIS